MSDYAKLNVVNNILGLRPALDNRQGDGVAVLRGRNFNFNTKGPMSGWGAWAMTADPIGDDKHPAIFRVKEHTYLFTCGMVRSLNAKCDNWTSEFIFDWEEYGDACDDYPWTSAHVDCTWFFSHPCAGVIYYDEFADEWGQWDMNEKCISGKVFGITQASERLIVLASDTVSWSEIDDGHAIHCHTSKGAGFQNLSIIRGGQPLGVYETTSGFMTYTTQGILYSREINSKATYRHEEFVMENVPINPFCIVQLVEEKQQIYLSKKGFYLVGRHANNQFAYEQWQPLMGQYVEEDELPALDLVDQAAIKMWYDLHNEYLFVSFRKEEDVPIHIYDRSLVYHFNIDKWSSFDRDHKAFGPTHFWREYIHQNALGYIGGDQLVREFDCGTRVDGAPIAGLTCEFVQEPLDSYIEIGLFKHDDGKYNDRTTFVTDVSATFGPAWAEDHELNETIKTHDAWEEHLEKSNRFCATIQGTLDGYQQYEDEWEALHIRTLQGRKRYYTCYNTGIYHTLRIATRDVGDRFNLSTVRLTAKLSGRL